MWVLNPGLSGAQEPGVLSASVTHSLFPGSSPPAREQLFLTRGLSSHTARAAYLLCQISKTPGQETASLSLRSQRRRHPSPELTRCQWGRITPRVSQTVEGETPLSAQCRYRKHSRTPSQQKGQCGRHFPISRCLSWVYAKSSKVVLPGWGGVG